ncbi:hypothetical protein BSL78_13010 [Apostichopus japonicus]|uniref:Reverse transcriptase domain-containing protein n=1 Tax=Stichopus japonicus TaxID=307972 RepID=A0A2G8KPZ3_STIJA|nr:hypothetical protein BSL78_13010 [Apostichopus japonicus]
MQGRGVRNPLGIEVDVLVEGHPCLSRGLRVPPCLNKLTKGGTCPIKLTVQNNSGREVKLQDGHLIGKVFLPGRVKPLVSNNQCNVFTSSHQVSAPKQLPFDLKDSLITTEWKHRFIDVLTRHKNAFSNDDLDIGCTSAVKHQIRLTDDAPFRQKSRGIPPADFEDTRRHKHDLLTKSRSYLVLLPGSLAWIPPDRNGRSRQNQHRILVSPGVVRIQPYAPRYLQCPATFQRLMEKCMGDMAFADVLVYMDDLNCILTYVGGTRAKVRQGFHAFGLRLNPDKCQFVLCEMPRSRHLCRRSANRSG